MAVFSDIYYPITKFLVVAPELVFVKILRVRRGGRAITDCGASAPGNDEFRYTASAGRIEFSALNPAESEDGGSEKIFIMYKS